MIATDALLHEIDRWTANNKFAMLDALSALVRVPSVRDDATAHAGQPFGEACARALDTARDIALHMGLMCQTHEGYALSVRYGAPQDAEIGVIAHLDVVPVENEWIFPPFCGRINDDYVLGRGAHDNKSACVMGLFLLKMLAEMQFPLKRGVRLVLGINEETGMEDMAYYAKNVPLPMLSLVPDSLYPVNFAQKWGLKGTLSIPLTNEIAFIAGGKGSSVPDFAECEVCVPFSEASRALEGLKDIACEAADAGTRIIAHGISTHPANPERGKSALLALIRALQRLPWKMSASSHITETLYELTCDFYGVPIGVAANDLDSGHTTFVITRARSENGCIKLDYSCRNSIHAQPNTILARFRAYCVRKSVEIENLATTRPVYFPKDDPRVEALMRVWRDTTHREDMPFASGGGTYSRALPNAITFGIIGCGCGGRPAYIPHDTGSAHEKNEYIDIAVVQRGVKLYAAALLELDRLRLDSVP